LAIFSSSCELPITFHEPTFYQKNKDNLYIYLGSSDASTLGKASTLLPFPIQSFRLQEVPANECLILGILLQYQPLVFFPLSSVYDRIQLQLLLLSWQMATRRQ